MKKKISISFLIVCVSIFSFFFTKRKLILASKTVDALCCFDSKVWRHRVLNSNDYDKHKSEFTGFEIDIVFIDSLNMFDLRHDVDGVHVGENLSDFLEKVDDSTKFFWLDFKNLNSKTVDSSKIILNQVLDKYQVKDQCIIESWNAKELGELSNLGMLTSLWIPHFDSTISENQILEYVKFIKKRLFKYDINALSAHCRMLPFLEKYFSDCNVHLWTNGLRGDRGKEKIRKIYEKDFVKVILIDYPNDDGFSKY